MTDSVPASDFPTSVSVDGGLTWLTIEGLKTVTPNPTVKKADNGTLRNEGWTSEKVVSRGLTIALDGLHHADPDTGVQDPGQAALVTLAQGTGNACKADFRMDTPDPAKTLLFEVSVDDVLNGGGSNEDLAPFRANLTVTSKPTVVARPTAA